MAIVEQEEHPMYFLLSIAVVASSGRQASQHQLRAPGASSRFSKLATKP
jgi:hypothetical protein